VTMKCAKSNTSARKRSGQLIHCLEQMATRLNWQEISVSPGSASLQGSGWLRRWGS